MNKTININLGGYFFHIDEEAYKKLEHYLSAVSRSLSDEPEGKEEIISDIESRISELLSQKMIDERQVINTTHIDEVIAIMGQPQDFSDDDSYKEETLEEKSVKKLYRDKEDRFLAGVCSGLGHYFGVDNRWTRLFFVLLLLAGVSPIIYIILWVIIPEAKTTAEKLEMKGKSVTIDAIEQKIREEFNTVSDKFKNGDYDDITEKTRSGARRFANFTADLLVRFIELFGKFFGFLITLIAGLLVLSTFLAFTNITYNSIDIETLLYDSTIPNWLIHVTLFFTIIIPIIGLFFIGLKIMFSTFKKLREPYLNKYMRVSMTAIWVISMLVVGYAITENEKATAYTNTHSNKQEISIDIEKPLEISIKEKKNMTITKLNLFNFTRKVAFSDDSEMKFSEDIDLSVKKSKTEKAYIEIEKESEGKDQQTAIENAQNLMYSYETLNNSLILDPYFLSNLKNMNKDEKVNIMLYLPENQTINFDEDSSKLIYRINGYKTKNHTFKMTNNHLKCMDCKNDE